MEAVQSQTHNPVQTASKGLHIGLWVLQVVFGAVFIGAGFMKIGTAQADIVAMGDHMAWAARMPEGLIKFIGVSELAGGLGLILPAATRVKTWLTPLAAIGLVTVMALAAGHHLLHGELSAIVPNLVMATFLGLIAYGRHKVAPISAR